METTQTIALPAHSLSHLLKHGEVTALVPIEGITNPERVEVSEATGSIPLIVTQHGPLCEGLCESSCDGLLAYEAPFRPGEVVRADTGETCTNCGGCGYTVGTKAAHAPDCDALQCSRDCPVPIETQIGCPCGGETLKIDLAVESIRGVEVIEMDGDAAMNMGFCPGSFQPLGPAWREFVRWWRVEHPAHPFESSYGWLLKLKRKDEDGISYGQ